MQSVPLTTPAAERIVNPFVVTRNFVIATWHIIDTLVGNPEIRTQYRRGYGQRQLASQVVTITGLGKFGRDKYFSELTNGHRIVSQDEYQPLYTALVQIMQERNVPIIDIWNPPVSLLLKYESNLRRIYGDDAVYRPRAAPELGDRLSTALQGMWRLFYLPPESTVTKTLVTNIVFFHNAGPRGSTAIGQLFGPNNTRWIASVTRSVEEYIQIIWSQYGGTESSSCLAAVDSLGLDAPKLIGVLSVLEQFEKPPRPYRPRKLVGSICFGTQCTLDNCGLGDISEEEPVPPSDEEWPILRAGVAEALRGAVIETTQERVMRKFFRNVDLPVHRVQAMFEDTVSFLKTIQEQERVFFSIDGLNMLCQETAS